MHRPIQATLSSNPRTLVALVFAFTQGCAAITSIGAEAADVQISDLNDLDFGAVPPTIGTLSANSDLCVPMAPRGRYSLVGFGNGSGGAFSLVDSGNGVHQIDYSVRISDRGQGRAQELNAGVPLTELRASRFLNNNRCNPRGNIEVIINGTDISGAPPGNYTGTLTLTVVPE